jgi:hypothetical protein
VREIRMLRAMWRELETGLRQLLRGHAGGNPDTAKELPTDYRASSRPYQVLFELAGISSLLPSSSLDS